MLLTWLLTCHCVVAAPAAPTEPNAQAQAQAQVDEHLRDLIGALAHPDPRERERAGKELVSIGGAARKAVVDATQSDDPELASRARGVLLRLPWSLPTDSPNARRLLSRYGQSGLDRRQIIGQLAAAPEVSPLLRLLEEEPEIEMRWHVARQLESVNDLELDRRLQEITVEETNSPAVFLAARKSLTTDRPRALKLLRRVIELEALTSAPAMQELFESFDELIREAARKSDYVQMAALLREQAERSAGTNLARVPVARLLALHAYVGPLPGYGRDVRVMGPAVGRPLFADAVALVYEQVGLAPPFPLATWAHARAPAPMEMRYWAGVFLVQHRLLTGAEHELNFLVAARVKSVPGEERGAPSFYDYDFITANAHEMLSRLTGERGDDLGAADHLKLAGELRGESELRIRGGRIAGANPAAAAAARLDDRSAEMHWRYLRAARTAGDQKKLREHLDVLKTLTPANTDIVLDVVPLLKEMGEPEAARAMFDQTYKGLRARVDADPASPEPMNNLAWLCARSGERLEEALDLATKAITLDPENAAYLDTAAEANFRAGNVDEAIRLETKGLEFRPNDKFMREQLERFKAGKK